MPPSPGDRLNLPDIFTEISLEMRSELEKTRAALGHSGLKGQANEESVRRFLADHFPPSLEFVSGQAVDATGRLSRQLDIMVIDRARTPIFYREGTVRVVPSEGLVAVVEVTAKLTRKKLSEAIENMLSVKTLEKTAYFEGSEGPLVATFNAYGQEWTHLPTFYFLFAFESQSLDRMREAAAQEITDRGLQPSTRIDTMCVLDAGVITNLFDDGMIDALPTASSSVGSYSTEHALLLFYLLISRYLLQAGVAPIEIRRYVPDSFSF